MERCRFGNIPLNEAREGLPAKYSAAMESLLVVVGVALLAAVTAMFLGARIGSPDVSDELATVRKNLARNRQRRALQHQPAPHSRHLILRRAAPTRKAYQVNEAQSIPFALPSPEFAPSSLLSREKTLTEAAGRLRTLKVLLPEDSQIEGKYIAELHSILDFMEEGSGLNLSRYRMSAPAVRTFLRINILALLSVCAYQSRPAAMPHSYRHNIRQASPQVH